MTGLAELRRWDSAGLEAALRSLGTVRDRLQDLDGDLATARPDGSAWRGTAADRARAGHDALAERARRMVAGLTAVRVALAETADAVDEIRSTLRRADDLAAARGFAIGPDGTVTGGTSGQSAERAEIVGVLRGALSRAAEVDARLRTTLERAVADQVDDGTGATLAGAAVTATGAGLPGPPAWASPAGNAAWWRGLDPAARERVLVEHPEWVGNLDGVPAAVRDEANRARLPEIAARLSADLAAAQARLSATPEPRPELREQVDRLREQRDALSAVVRAAAPAGRQLLLVDLDGHATPRAAVAVGDVDTARHVGVFTPGFTTTVAGDLRNHTQSLAAAHDAAAVLLDHDGRAGEPVATVAWLGYDAPQWDTITEPDRSVLTDTDAATAGADLARFYDGIAASRPGDHPHLTALGHSYGSTVTGFALRHTAAPVDDAVLFGSPGLSTDRVGDLHVPAGHTAVIEADGDPVADLGAFGTDPNQLPGVVPLASHGTVAPDGALLQPSTGHDEYFAPGTTSQRNIAATVAGLPQRRVVGTDRDAGDVVRGVLAGVLGEGP